MATQVVLYGLCIRSDGLVRGPVAEPGRSPDVEIAVAPPQPPNAAAPDGELLAEDLLSEQTWYRFAKRPDGTYLLRYAPVCDFVISADLRHVDARPVAGTDPDLVSVLAGGGLLAFILMMKNEPLLHASAVDIGGSAVAFVGRSGMGKSTLAALCCAEGVGLITDDVLRLRLPADGAPECYLGPSEVRLRPASEPVARQFDGETSRRLTGDGRLALGPERAAVDLLPLAAIVIPVPDRDAESPSLTRLGPVDAVLALLSFPRIVGWIEDDSQAGQFQHAATIAERTPVFTCTVPWGPPFDPGLGNWLIETVRSQSSGPA